MEPEPPPEELFPAEPLPLLDEAPLLEPLDDVPEPPFAPPPLPPADCAKADVAIPRVKSDTAINFMVMDVSSCFMLTCFKSQQHEIVPTKALYL
ncbi:hypothetical protein BJF91_16160 [Allorhizobium taibaishanense]|uniref:Uncharacterized protein n=1 Tax=Allorhizobium taibaishanense TaxID=887144 RepID=A0A1Q9A9Q8_9HYPH|nr:hypothetical protein BJF91_16160 [Allorhizobium taibaishanense]